ncbi:MAG: hypothetical protein J6X91_07535 [Bacteroidales bacterium]|nr:hypothetical protein [Bacteroidales bacterium]MBP5518489.1 hypothetical protein [Bacteroidales bacterium]
MKTVRFLFVILLASIAVSCSKHEEEKAYGTLNDITMVFSVSDANGNDLLNPEYENNILEGTTLLYRKKVYPVDQTLQNNLDNFKNGSSEWKNSTCLLQLLSSEWVQKYVGWGIAKDQYHLYIGPLNPIEQRDEDIIINWGDGSKDVIHYYYHYDEKKKKASRRVMFNNKFLEDKISIRLDLVK